jgi:hypothetical protein
LQFRSEDWSEDMEEELCILWDMTVEAEVAELLMQHDFLDLSSRIIRDTTIPRLMVSYDCGDQYDNFGNAVQLLQLALWLEHIWFGYLNSLDLILLTVLTGFAHLTPCYHWSKI